MLTTSALFLLAAALAVAGRTRAVSEVLMSRSRFAHVRLPPPEDDAWHPSVPVWERYESVTVVQGVDLARPGSDSEPAVRIVEHMGSRRELVSGQGVRP